MIANRNKENKNGSKEHENKSKFTIKLINIQGLTNIKYTELVKEINTNSIICLTETQKKIDNIKTSSDIQTLSSMRKVSERKGGVLMILYQKQDDIALEKIVSINSDILITEGNIGKLKTLIILTYFRSGNTREVESHNTNLITEIEKYIRKGEEKENNIILLGDFNGHLGYIGYQIENRTGKIINKLIENNDLILLNIDPKCDGKYTWQRNNEKSVIDLILVNRKMYNSFQTMEIDEKKEKIDLSDHNMIEVTFRTFMEKKETWNKWTEREYYRFDEESLKNYLSEVRQNIINHEEIDLDIDKMNEFINDAAEKTLKRT